MHTSSQPSLIHLQHLLSSGTVKEVAMGIHIHIQHPWTFTFGFLGNIVSLMVFLAPIQTFYKIHKKKSTEGFQSVPYVVALFSAMLWMYYGFIKSDVWLLITINSFGCVIETIYIAMFFVYAPRKARMNTAKLFLFLNLGLFSLILLSTHFLVHGSIREKVLGWICVVFSTCVFVAPLSIMMLVIRTKSVEFMPFSLSFFLTLNAIMWFTYGFMLKNIYVALPNVLGFIFGILQIILYLMYKDTKGDKEEKLPEQSFDVIISTLGNSEVYPVEIEDQKVHDKKDKNDAYVNEVQMVECQV